MLEIDNKKNKTVKKTCVKELIELIEDKNYILELILRIKIQEGMEYRQAKNTKTNRQDEIMREIENFEIDYDIEQDAREKFINIFRQLDSKDFGELLEYIIATKGPCELEKEETCFSCESKVYHEQIQSNHNFDVIFYSNKCKRDKRKNHVLLNDVVEFHECKNNIQNWIPNERKLDTKNNKKAFAKLEFIKDVHNVYEQGLFFMPTFAYHVTAKQKCLNEWGLEFIRILGIKDLLKVLSK